MPSAMGPGTTLRRPRTRQIAVPTMVMPTATATGTMLLAELHVSNCTENFTSSVNHRSCRIMLPTTYDESDWLTKSPEILADYGQRRSVWRSTTFRHFLCVPEASVVVVGAGAAGLSAAAALKRKGIDAVVLEEDARVGGTWARRYDRLHLHTLRGFSGLAHYGIPRRFPKYLSRDEFIAYLGEYAQHFGLRIITDSPVKKIAKDPQASNGWKISTTGDSWRSRAVVIAAGNIEFRSFPGGRDRISTKVSYCIRRVIASRRRMLASACWSSAPEIVEPRSQLTSPRMAQRSWR